MKRSHLCLWSFTRFAELFILTGKLKLAIAALLMQRCEYVVDPVNVRIHGRKPIIKTLRDKALRRQIIVFIKRNPTYTVKNARISFKRCGMQNQLRY